MLHGGTLKSMTTLKKLKDKNKAYKSHHRNEAMLGFVGFVLCIPFLLGIVININVIPSWKGFHLWIYMLGWVGFCLPLGALGEQLLLTRKLKLLLLVVAQIWFVAFWTFYQQSWFAYIPLVITIAVFNYQLSAIKLKAKEEGTNR